MSTLKNRNVILIGMPGSGKSTVGVILAKICGKDFIDTDLIIIKQSNAVLPEILEISGADGFLEIENNVGSELDAHNSVIATGGSMVLSEHAMRNLKRQGTVVWLDVPLIDITSRIPVDLNLRGIAAPAGASIEDVYSQRLAYYKKYADIIVSPAETAEKTAEKIFQALLIENVNTNTDFD